MKGGRQIVRTIQWLGKTPLWRPAGWPGQALAARGQRLVYLWSGTTDIRHDEVNLPWCGRNDAGPFGTDGSLLIQKTPAMSGHEPTMITPLANKPTALPRQRTVDVGWALKIVFHVLSRRKDILFSKSPINLSNLFLQKSGHKRWEYIKVFKVLLLLFYRGNIFWGS